MTLIDNTLPLAVDLDGTLIRTDSLWESILCVLREQPWMLFLMPLWLFQGKARFKAQIARHATLDAAALPYDSEVLAYARAAALAGRPVALVTAADQSVADAVAKHLKFFGLAKGSEAGLNLGGRAKAVWLSQMYPHGFEYVGDHAKDEAVWKAAAVATTAGRHADVLLQRYLGSHTSAKALPYRRPVRTPLRLWLSAIRIHQWSKNALLFVPFLMAGKLMGVMDFVHVVMGFFAFSLLASATYIINDLLDLPNDRKHPVKSKRAFANCFLSIPQGIAAIGVLLLGVVAILSVLAIPAFIAISLCYAAVTLAYSFFLKREVLVDVMVLAGLYTLRISAGATILALPISWWLVSFSFLFFLSLALMKRYAELDLMQRNGKFATGRNYQLVDMPLLRGMGVSASFSSVVLFVIYLVLEHFSASMFSNPGWLWPIGMVILLWQARLWLLTNRGDMHQDPIYFALKDKGSIKLGALCMLLLVLAW